ncbi:hypothetical protein [Achromobacter sp. AGC25]
MLPLIEGGGIQSSQGGVWIFGIDEGEEYAQPPGWMGKMKYMPTAWRPVPPNTS